MELRDGAFRCHGGYAELDIVARPEDEAILMEAFPVSYTHLKQDLSLNSKQYGA